MGLTSVTKGYRVGVRPDWNDVDENGARAPRLRPLSPHDRSHREPGPARALESRRGRRTSRLGEDLRGLQFAGRLAGRRRLARNLDRLSRRQGAAFGAARRRMVEQLQRDDRQVLRAQAELSAAAAYR